jgi:hypothetical protein
VVYTIFGNNQKSEMKEIIENRKSAFKTELNNDLISDTVIIRKNLLHGNPIIYLDDEDKYFFLKQKVANFFKVSTKKVVMVGSAKLGFSIAPKKIWNDFNEESDIDIVVISETIFDEYWQELLNFNINVKARSEQEDKNYREFLEYFLKGWIRPDFKNKLEIYIGAILTKGKGYTRRNSQGEWNKLQGASTINVEIE